jgi:hypothetical protein
MSWRVPELVWLIGGLTLAGLLALALIRWPAWLRGPAPLICSTEAVVPGPLRPAVQSAIEHLASEPLAGATQATDRIAPQAGAPRRIAEPADFPASTYIVRFGPAEGRFAVIANAETRVPHYSPVTPGMTDVGGYVRLDGFATLSAETSLTAAEIDYLLHILYARICPAGPDPEAAVLNRLKDAVLTIRFGPGPELAIFHRDLVSRLSGPGAIR